VACLSKAALQTCLAHVQSLQWAWRADRLNALRMARALTPDQRLDIAKAMEVGSLTRPGAVQGSRVLPSLLLHTHT
jgi:hypothetical protein